MYEVFGQQIKLSRDLQQGILQDRYWVHCLFSCPVKYLVPATGAICCYNGFIAGFFNGRKQF